MGIILGPSPQLAVAILGVLKAGGAYLPMDPEYPADRIRYLLADAAARVVIATRELAALAEGARLSATVLLGGADTPPPGPDDNQPDVPSLESAAYVVYTSGSTGQPKGVVIEHRPLAVFAREVADRLQLGAGDRFLQFASPSFDVLAEELFPIWLAGGAGGVVRIGLGEREFTPPEISAFILRELKRRAEGFFAGEGDIDPEVDRAVITVPAYANA